MKAKRNKNIVCLIAKLILFVVFSTVANQVFASDTQTISGIASNITSTFNEVAKLITAVAYISGLGFAVGAIFKFKQHKDNPTQIPVGTPIALLFIGAALIFMPNVFGIAGNTVFGSANAGTNNAGTSVGRDPFGSS